MVTIILSFCGCTDFKSQPMVLGWRLPFGKFFKEHITINPTWSWRSTPSLQAQSLRTLSNMLFALCWCKDKTNVSIHSFALLNWCIWTIISQFLLSRLFLPCWHGARQGCWARFFFPSSTQTLRAPSSCWNVNPRFSCVCYGCAGPQRTHNAVTT